jgi:hypothetical protein
LAKLPFVGVEMLQAVAQTLNPSSAVDSHGAEQPAHARSSAEVSSILDFPRGVLPDHLNQVEVVKFVDQSHVQSRAYTRSAIQISGAVGVNAATINGIWIPYRAGTNENLFYVKECDDSKRIEHCGTSWRVKPVDLPGSPKSADDAGCWAFLKVCAPLESCSSDPSIFEWKVASTGSVLPPKSAEQAHSAWTTQTCVTIKTVGVSALGSRDILIQGATGPIATKINGNWKRSLEISGGFHVYSKHGDIGVCIEHLTSIGRWQIKPVSCKGKNVSWASVEGGRPFEDCLPLVWRVSESSGFQTKVDQPSVKISLGSYPVCRPLSTMIYASGFSLTQFNGVFVRDPVTLSYHHTSRASLRIELQPQHQAPGASTADSIVGKCFDGPTAYCHVHICPPHADAFAQGDVFYGSFKSRSGTYEGQWANGSMNGHGVMRWNDGGCYIGSWVSGRRTGLGMYRWPDGSVFEGPFLNGLKNGQGSITFATDGHRHVNKGLEKESAAQMTPSLMSAGNVVFISGATGPHAAGINGAYDQTSEMFGGYTLYAKRGDASQCIEHFGGKWQVKAVSDKGSKDSCTAYVAGGCGLEACTSRVWNVYDGKAWNDAPSVKLVAGAEAQRQVRGGCLHARQHAPPP